MTKLRYWHYRQNNTGGRFKENESVAVNVFVQASSAKDADRRASEIGIYFDTAYRFDCDCCGQRWYSQGDMDGTDEPCFDNYSDSPVTPERLKIHRGYSSESDVVGYVYDVDGTKKVLSV